MNYTLLNANLSCGNLALQVLKEYGTTVKPTDLAFLLGASCFHSKTKVWTSSPDGGAICIVKEDGSLSSEYKSHRDVCTRPVISPKQNNMLQPLNRRKTANNITVVEYGMYPQKMAEFPIMSQLESLYQEDMLKTTGKTYTFDSYDNTNYTRDFSPMSFPEFEYKGVKYIRIKSRTSGTIDNNKISNGDIFWIKVSPIEWLVDQSGYWISKYALFAGIQFANIQYELKTETEKNRIDMSETVLGKYLNTYFANEIVDINDKKIKEFEESVTENSIEPYDVLDAMKDLKKKFDDIKQKVTSGANLTEEDYQKYQEIKGKLKEISQSLQTKGL